MRTQKLTPTQKKEIATRVGKGERPSHLAKEFGVSPSLVTRIVKQARLKAESEVSDAGVSVVRVDLLNKTADQLRNRYRQCHIELMHYHSELQQRLLEADGLQQSIEIESAKADGVRDDSWILAQKKRLVWCQDHKRIGFSMAKLYEEISAILHTLIKRGVAIPVGESVLKGLRPVAKTQ